MKKSRKKILLSSIAMLLVALVALGSATFAWFTINKEVTADAMNVKAATAAGLQITKNNGNTWARDVSFTQEEAVLSPTSRSFTTTALGDAGYLPGDVSTEGSGARAWDNAAGATNYTTNWAADVGRPTVPSGNVDAQAKNANYAEFRVGIQSSNANTTLTGVKMNVNFTPANDSKEAAKFIRVVVLEEGANDAETVKAYIAEGGASTNAITAIDSTDKVPTSVLAQQSTSNTDIAIGSVSTAKYYRIVVWFEGQDADCTDANQSAAGSIDVKFFF